MAKYAIDSTTLTAIADAIRTKTGGSSPITPRNMPTAISGISGGGGNVVGFIRAIGKSGDTITAAKGGTVLTSDGSANYVFDIPEEGTWVITNGDFSASFPITYPSSIVVNTIPLIAHSVYSNILAEEKSSDYIEKSGSFGEFIVASPGTIIKTKDDAIRLDAYGEYIGYALADANHNFTAYMVAKSNTSASGSYRTLMGTYSNKSGYAPGFFRKDGNIWTTAYYQDVDSGYTATDLHVFTLAVDVSLNSKYAYFYIDGTLVSTKGINGSGQVIGFGGEPNQFGSHDDINVYYVAVVDGCDDDATIVANHTELMNEYGIGE